MELTDRIRTIMKMNNMNAAAFADRIGVQRANMSHVLTGRNKPSLDFIERILINFPKVNAQWLITGKVGQEEIQKSQVSLSTERIDVITEVKSDSSPTNEAEQKSPSKTKARKIVKIITFYEDFTFDEYQPSSKQ